MDHYLATAEQMRKLDADAIAAGTPSLVLMERAAGAVARAVLATVAQKPLPDPVGRRNGAMGLIVRLPSAHVFCGTGGNGGDGFAVARLLQEAGWAVKAFLVGNREKMTEDCREMEHRFLEVGGVVAAFAPDRETPYYPPDVAVDALYGVGLTRAVTGDGEVAIRQGIQRAGYIVSVDMPSGVWTDSGRVASCAVRADETVTFTCGKPGLYVGEGALCSGKVTVADIGIEPPRTNLLLMTRPTLPPRKRDTHKGDFGRVHILAGSVGYTGAPVLAARAAVRGGAGLVYLGVPPEIYPIIAGKCDEEMPYPLPEETGELIAKLQSADVVLIGPGLGRSPRAEALLVAVLEGVTCPVVVDADGLNLLGRHIDILDSRTAPTLLTPHDGEFLALGGTLAEGDRLGGALAFVKAHVCTLILKGHRTITAVAEPTGNGVQVGAVIHTTGNPGMARGGSGDALAGLLAALVAQKHLRDGALLAPWIHGRAGDLAAADKGEYGMTVGDLIGQIPYAMKECTEQ